MFVTLALVALIAPGVHSYCELCLLGTVHGKEAKNVSTPMGNLDDYPHCHHYQDNACCSAEVVQNLIELYG